MNTYDKLIHFSADAKFDVSADEWRRFLDELMRHFKSGKSPASGSNLMGVMSVLECQAQLDSGDKAEAMQCGFRLAMHLAQSDFPLVQKEIRQTRQKQSTAKKRDNLNKRDSLIVADYDKLLATEPKHKIASILAKNHKLKPRTIRDIIKKHRMK